MNTQTKLGEIITQIRGVSYKPSDVRAAGDPDAVALLRANNIQEDGLNFDDLIWVDKQKVGAEQYLRLGDILICSSSGSKGLVGKAAIVTSDLSCAFGAFCKVVRTKAEYASYLGQFFRSPRYRKEISASAAGANINNIRNEHIDEMFISMPSANERAGCVAKLGQIDYLIQKINNQSHQLDQLVKSRFVEMFGDPITNKMGWPCLSLAKTCRAILGGGTPSKSHPEYFTGDIPWVSPKDMKYAVISDSIDHITDEAVVHSTTNLVPKNSVLMVIRSGILKHTLPVAINSVPVTINQDMKAFVPGNGIITEFLMYYFKAIESDVLAGVRGVTADNIDFKAFQQRTIIVPPLELQNRFAAFVAEVDKSKLAVKQSLEKLETLKKSLMRQYFG